MKTSEKKYILTNLNEFLANFSWHQKPFEILANFEKSFYEFDSKPSIILAPYKEDGDVIFELISINELVYVYQFTTTVS